MALIPRSQAETEHLIAAKAACAQRVRDHGFSRDADRLDVEVRLLLDDWTARFQAGGRCDP